MYSGYFKTSTVKSRYLRNLHEFDLSSQLGYSNALQFNESNRNSTPILSNVGQMNSSSKNTTSLESGDSANNQTDNQTNDELINGGTLYRHSRNGQAINSIRRSTNSTNYHSSQVTDLIDENNNSLNSEDDEIPVCFSYIQDCAIYGTPDRQRKRTYKKLLKWYIFSIIYDLKWFAQKEWRTLLKLIFLFILFELIYAYFIHRV